MDFLLGHARMAPALRHRMLQQEADPQAALERLRLQLWDSSHNHTRAVIDLAQGLGATLSTQAEEQPSSVARALADLTEYGLPDR